MKPPAHRVVLHTPVSLAERRQQLLLRSAQLREQVGRRAGVLQPALHWNDRLRGGLQALRRHQGLGLLGGAALLGVVFTRPRLAVNLGLRAWSGWQLFRRVQPLAFALWRQFVR